MVYDFMHQRMILFVLYELFHKFYANVAFPAIYAHFLPNRKYRKYRVIIVSKPKISCNIVWTLKKISLRGEQDSASPHCTDCTFLASKIGDRVISRRTEHHWPPYSPDLNPLDFSFWSQAMAHAVRCEPTTRRRAQQCVQQAGCHFQHLLK